jgi:hypothetical protein
VSEPCADCLPAAGDLVSPEIAAAITGTSVRAVFRFIEAGVVHYREGDEGQIGVCINALALCVTATNGEFTVVRKEIGNEKTRELTPFLK